MPTKSKAIVCTGVNTLDTQEVIIPDPGDGEVLVRAEFTCVSSGTEMRVAAGRQADPPDWPFITGYAMSGHVVSCGKGVAMREGTAVLCSGTTRASVGLMFGGHVEYAVTPERAVYALPADTDLSLAPLLKLAAISYHGYRLSRPMAHENVVVVGLGPIGMFSARLHTMSGANVIAADRVPERVRIAKNSGVQAVHVEGRLKDALAGAQPKGADIVVDGTGSEKLFPEGIEMMRNPPWTDELIPEGRYLLQGSYAVEFTIPYQPAFRRELRFLCTRDTQPRDINTVIDLYRRSKLDLSGIISQVCKPEDAQAAYDEIRTGDGTVLSVAFDWR